MSAAPAPTVAEALRLLRIAIYQEYQRRATWVEITTDGPRPIGLPLPDVPGGTVPAVPPPSNGEAAARNGQVIASNGEDCERQALSPVIIDILRTLRESGKPLTKFKLLEEMNKQNRIWGESTVMRYLKILMEAGDVENPEGVKPRGYRLPEWDSTCDRK